jgi:hypothetical protein
MLSLCNLLRNRLARGEASGNSSSADLGSSPVVLAFLQVEFLLVHGMRAFLMQRLFLRLGANAFPPCAGYGAQESEYIEHLRLPGSCIAER